MHWQHSTSTPRPRWFKTDETIEHWLKERQTLLILYNELCRLIRTDHQQTIKTALLSFCQILIDYVSAGHFEIFERLAEAESQCSSQVSLDPDILINILRTTNFALEFNDKYSSLENLNTLYEDLSNLGEQLANRMDWEDSLIKTYLKITQEAPSASPSAPSI